MTEDEAIAKLAAINVHEPYESSIDGAMIDALGDAEAAHGASDKLAAEALRQLGWHRFADAYTAARDFWWYA